MYYFAYGSNMNLKQMEERCGKNAKFLKRAFLKGFKFVYDGYSVTRKGAVANIIETGNESDIVWGGLFEIDKECNDKLDRFEGYPKAYNRKVVPVHDDEGNTYCAIVYYRTGEKEAKPSESYKEVVIKGAIDCGIPEDYIVKFLDI